MSKSKSQDIPLDKRLYPLKETCRWQISLNARPIWRTRSPAGHKTIAAQMTIALHRDQGCQIF